MWPLWTNRLILAAAIACLAMSIFLAWSLLARTTPPRISHLRRWIAQNPAEGVIATYPLLLLLAHCIASIALGTWFIDRYFLLLLPFLTAGILIIGRERNLLITRRQVAVPGAVFLVFATWGLHVVDFDAKFDGARWGIGKSLVARGYAPEEIDAGMQWVSYHALNIGLGAQQVPIRPGRQWWTERYPEQRICVTVQSTESEPKVPAGTINVWPVEALFGSNYFLVAKAGPDSC